MVHIGDRVNTVLKINAKIEKIGTSYFTISVNASSTQGNIVEYIYVIDGIEKAPTDKNIYTEENLGEKSEHTAKVIVVDEKGNRKTSREFKIVTEPRTYLYKDGAYSDKVTDWVYGGYAYIHGGTFAKYESYFTVVVQVVGDAYMVRSNELVDFSGYTKLCSEISMSFGHPASSSHMFLSTVSEYNNVDNWSGNLGVADYITDSNATKSTVDISNINTNAYIYFRQTHAGSINIYKVWLEK